LRQKNADDQQLIYKDFDGWLRRASPAKFICKKFA